MFNKFYGIGFLGMDPNKKVLESGQTLATFTVASSRKYKDKNGDRKSETEWHPCVAFGKLADLAVEYLRKGKKVQIEGRLQTRSYTKTIGGEEVKFFRTEIILENFIMLDAREREVEPEGNDLPNPDDLFPTPNE